MTEPWYQHLDNADYLAMLAARGIDLEIYFAEGAIPLRSGSLAGVPSHIRDLKSTGHLRVLDLSKDQPSATKIGNKGSIRSLHRAKPARLSPQAICGRDFWVWMPAQEVPEGGSAERSKKATPAPKTLVLAPEAARPELTIPPHLEAWCAREDVHPVLGDYVVIPSDQAAAWAPLEPWMVVRPEVHELQLVKPRLGW